ncbi:hypothetical protein B484DRAFT_443614 [Ochromonadaceae sp. CCMP2298]|nr:hypothetical protein B484DRAFT_443614 [Ochromonadaceae sp. CCMP2298]
MLTSLPFGLVQYVLSFGDAAMISSVMCSSKELRDSVSATMAQSKAIVFVRVPCVQDAPKQEYGPTLKQWLRHYPPTATSMSLRDCHFLTDAGCKVLAARFPLLESLDLSGCTNVTSIGAKRFSKGKLSHFCCDLTRVINGRKDLRITPAYVKAIALSKCLTCLSLTLGTRNRASALAPLHQHPSLRELNLYFEGFHDISLDIHLPALQRLRLYRGEWAPQSWRAFFHTLCKSGGIGGSGGSGGNGGSSGSGGSTVHPLCNLPNLQFLHIHSNRNLLSSVKADSAMPELLCPDVLAALPRSQLVSIVVSPCTAEHLSQWAALGPRNSLGTAISLSIGENWFQKI